MKKIIALLLCLGLLSAAGCTKAPINPTTEPTSETTVPIPTDTQSIETTTPLVTVDGPFLAFSAPFLRNEYRAKDGSLLFTYTSQNISLILEDPQVADAVVIDILNLTDYENSSAKQVLADAQQAYSGQAVWTPYTYSTVFSPMRFDAAVLSLYGTQAVFNGSPRSTAANMAVTYDLITGRPLELKEVLIADFSADALSTLISVALHELESQGMLYSDYAYVISDMFSTNRPVDTWFFSNRGLCFFFAPYEIAPYSTGTVVAEIPYESLTGLLKDEYFPAEQIRLSGTVNCEPFTTADLSGFTQFAELILDESGKEYLLHANGCLRNVRIQAGSWLDDENFLPDATVFAAPFLSGSNALMIQFSADAAQDLLLTYEDGDQVVSLDLLSLIENN